MRQHNFNAMWFNIIDLIMGLLLRPALARVTREKQRERDKSKFMLPLARCTAYISYDHG